MAARSVTTALRSPLTNVKREMPMRSFARPVDSCSPHIICRPARWVAALKTPHIAGHDEHVSRLVRRRYRAVHVSCIAGGSLATPPATEPVSEKVVAPKGRDVGPLPGITKRGPLRVLAAYILYFLFLLLLVPFWTYQAAKMALAYITTFGKAFQQTDWGDLEFPDPFPGLSHEYVDVNNVRLHVVRASPKRAGKKLMLFVHGFPEGWFSWKNQMEVFKDDYDVVAFDMRGYGRSSKPVGRDNYRAEFLVADIVRLVEALGYDKCALVCHDWGSIIGWWVAALHPDLVEALVITCVPHLIAGLRNVNLDQLRKSWYVFLFQAPFLGQLYLSAGDKASVNSWVGKYISPAELDGWKAELSRPGVLTSGINYYRAFVDVNIGRKPSPQNSLAKKRLAAAELPMPVLMLYAESDMALGLQLLKGTEEYVPNLELHVVPGPHFLPLARPQQVTDYIRGFLAKNKI